MNGKPLAVSLFSGAGGLDLGFEQAGWEIGVAVEIDSNACDTFARNHPQTFLLRERDICNVSGEELKAPLRGRKINAVIGGPVCQGHSVAHKRLADDPRNQLFMEYLRIVDELQPDIAVAENVKGILSTREGAFLNEIIYKYEQIGYSVDYKILNAADFGVPQKRERVIFIANRSGAKNCFPIPTYCNPKKIQYDPFGQPLKDWLTVEKVLDDLPVLNANEGEEESEYNQEAKTPYQMYCRTGDTSWLQKPDIGVIFPENV